jgi:hypothetical protein
VSGPGELYSPAGPLEKRGADLPFQLGDLGAERAFRELMPGLS